MRPRARVQAKAERFGLLDPDADASGRFFWFKCEARHALIGERHQDGAVFLQLGLVGVLDAPPVERDVGGSRGWQERQHRHDVAVTAAKRATVRITRPSLELWSAARQGTAEPVPARVTPSG